MQMQFPKAKILKWVDGDTVDCLVDLGFNVSINQRFRLCNVNTPEKGAEGYLEALLASALMAPVGSQVSITCTGKDKYGRWIADIVTKEFGAVSQMLLDKGLAVIYN